MNTMYNVGGVYLTEVKDGTVGTRSQPVSRDVQKASMKWAIKQLRNSDWLDDKALISKFSLNAGMTSKVRAAAMKMLLGLSKNVTLSSYLSDKPYPVGEYFDDLYIGIFESLFKNIIYNHFNINDIKARYIIFSEQTTFRS